MRRYKKSLAHAGILSVMGISFVAALLVITTSVPEITVEHIRSWQHVPMITGDNDPGAGNSGVLRVYVHRHNDDGENFYGTNITLNSSVFAYGDVNNSHIGSNVNYSTPIDIVIKVRWNQTHAFEPANSSWMWGWVNGWYNSTGLAVASLQMVEVNITASASSTYAFAHYIANNSNNGYQISKGENITQNIFNFNAYY